ncbi:HAMP domain-containing sensor histidine kinase [Parachryseolinea silvisoli]|uniref:HAMP domain-containing sensor histidine kinase n=1 Tax=Parachryseolinea silvisoli TaxID=2873601 RepID=UPI0022658429|nr:ATP-binding protein [Parachryseolinea silvisoli]MCD9018668.1 HAMP domain-containing protein [Parachryseolinea silvisoli]
MSIKTKVAWGVTFLFALILAIGGLGLYSLHNLARSSQQILVDNYESIEYAHQILAACEQLRTDPAVAMKSIETSLTLQETNVTEPGEREATLALRSAFEKLRNTGLSDSVVARIRHASLALENINMKAIVRKNETTQETAHDASTYLIIICTLCSLAAFTFIVNFPGYIANPVIQLTNSIKSIAGKNYEERLHFDRRDEFEELAEAFNQMAEKLDEYEHSNLARILFEKKRIEAIIHRVSDPVIGLDEKSRIIFANERALDILNLSREELLDHYAPDVAVNNDLFRSLIKSAASDNPEKTLIKAMVGLKENFFTQESVRVSYSPTGEKERVDIGTVILLKNVTTYKEQDLAKTNFIATVSHELKTPIAALQMGVKLLQDTRVGALNDEQANITRTLHDEIWRLSKITHELLDLSQVETGNIKLDIRKTTPADIIQMATEAVQLQAERKPVYMAHELAADLPPLLADADKTTWVLVNFLTNAIRYSPERGTILIRAARVGHHVRLSVQDNGPGIEARYKARIFEKYFQVPGTPTGTGLGLAISKEFIEAQGGGVQVESEPGKGSTFSFHLPVA